MALADSRKIFRIGKYLNEYSKILDIINRWKSRQTEDRFESLFNFLARVNFAGYWVMDSLFILNKLQVLPGTHLPAACPAASQCAAPLPPFRPSLPPPSSAPLPRPVLPFLRCSSIFLTTRRTTDSQGTRLSYRSDRVTSGSGDSSSR